MLCREVQNYISSVKGLPFFYVAGDEDYCNVLEELKQAGVSVVRMSDFCPKDDKFPSVDDLVDHFRTSDVDYRDNKFVVIGLGEYLALRGADYAEKELRRLKNTTLGNARAILLLRGVAAQAKKIIADDSRMREQQRAYVCSNVVTNISVSNVERDFGLVTKKGIKNLLKQIEDGLCGNVLASTGLLLENSLLPIITMPGPYSVIKLIVKDFDVEKECGNDEQWSHLLADLNKCGRRISRVFEQYGIDEAIFDDLYSSISGYEYRNWLVFLFFKVNADQLKNSYLRLAVEKTAHFDDLKSNILTLITELSHDDSRFIKMYAERKRLLKGFQEEDIAIFMKANEADPAESIYRYTDNTMLERKAVIKWIATYGMNDAISYVYPALNDYLKKYVFDCPSLAAELTEYFDLYKQQKVTNRIMESFMQLVEKYATEIVYAKLPTRDNAVKSIASKDKTHLYWIDALGVEYLSYIAALAKQKGLSMHVDVTRSDIPTITSINRHFYDQWTGGRKFKEDRLDDIKHKAKGGYFFTDDETPIHLAAELDVIETAISTAATELAMHKCQAFVIASDHGASRLAVIKKQEVPYDTDTKGEHSGRCCKAFKNCNLQYKVEENEFIALADYGRFRGSRAANVEVHGGASLEEIVVPVITLTLKKQLGIQIKVMNPDDITADRHNGVVLAIYISDVGDPSRVKLIIDNRPYSGKTEDGLHFTFELKDIKRARTVPYTADVFDSDDLIGNISFKVKGKAATLNEDFDFGTDF